MAELSSTEVMVALMNGEHISLNQASVSASTFTQIKSQTAKALRYLTEANCSRQFKSIRQLRRLNQVCNHKSFHKLAINLLQDERLNNEICLASMEAIIANYDDLISPLGQITFPQCDVDVISDLDMAAKIITRYLSLFSLLQIKTLAKLESSVSKEFSSEVSGNLNDFKNGCRLGQFILVDGAEEFILSILIIKTLMEHLALKASTHELRSNLLRDSSDEAFSLSINIFSLHLSQSITVDEEFYKGRFI